MMGLFQKSKVVIVVNSLLTHAGVEQRTFDLAEFLVKRGFHVEVFVLRAIGKVATSFEEMRVRVRFIQVYEYTDGGHYRFSLSRFLQLCWRLWSGRFYSIFCVQPPSYFFARLAVFPPLGRKIVAMERFLVSGRSQRRLWLDWLFAQWTTKIVCVSTLVRDQLIADAGLTADKVVAIENGVAVAPVNDSFSELKESIAGKFVFGCVATLTARKRQGLILESLAQLCKSTHGGSHPLLILVGGGDDEPVLRQRVRELGIDANVMFAGETAHPHDYFRVFNCFVFPSIGEGFGNAWAEAMMHGLPVICANVRPMSDYVTHDVNGFLFPPDDSGALMGAMKRLRADSTLRERLGQNARQFAHEHFQRDRQLAKLVRQAIDPEIFSEI